jgi:hypothetical protein
LLETFVEAENLTWGDPWLQHRSRIYNIDPLRGLFFGVTLANNCRVEQRYPSPKRYVFLRQTRAPQAGRMQSLFQFRRDEIRK